MKKGLLVLAATVLLALALAVQSAAAADRMYTSNSDFDEGVSTSVVHETAGELQLDDASQILDQIWIPGSDTVRPPA